MSFKVRSLSIEINIPEGVEKYTPWLPGVKSIKSTKSGSTLRIEGFMVRATIYQQGDISPSSAEISIANLPYETMCAFSGLFKQGLFFARNSDGRQSDIVSITLFDTTDSESGIVIYRGAILNGRAQINAAPTPLLTFTSNSILAAQLTAMPPISEKGMKPSAEIAKQIAQNAGVGFQNRNVKSLIRNPRFEGDFIHQITELAEQGHFTWAWTHEHELIIQNINDQKYSNVKIWNLDSTGGKSDIEVLGWPEDGGNGVALRTEFNPQFHWRDIINLKTSTPHLSAKYTIYQITHHVDAIAPDGKWESQINASFIELPLGTAPVVE